MVRPKNIPDFDKNEWNGVFRLTTEHKTHCIWLHMKNVQKITLLIYPSALIDTSVTHTPKQQSEDMLLSSYGVEFKPHGIKLAPDQN